MRPMLLLFLALMSGQALADDYYYLAYYDGIEDVQYPTPDAACHAIYDNWQVSAANGGYSIALPYQDPVVVQNTPKSYTLSCTVSAQNPSNGIIANPNFQITRKGDNCTSTQLFNPLTGLCESPDEDQARKELGDPTNPEISGIVACGDPVNVAVGNVFLREEDYTDKDGELRFYRYYNSAQPAWGTSYATRLYFDPKALVIVFEDRRMSVFKLENGIAVPEATERGSLVQAGGVWTYYAPNNEQYAFDTQGRLTRWQMSNSRSQTIAYTASSSGDTIMTVTDSRGHSLSVVSSLFGSLKTLTVGGLTVAYTFPNQFSQYQLTSVARSWAGHTETTNRIYSDPTNSYLLTGLIDAKGNRAATWAYDSQGRAVSNQLGGGANQVSFTYNADGSSTVTNALGHSVTFHYQIIQGAKRVVGVVGEPALSCPASNSTYTYTAAAQVDTQTDALGHVTKHSYDVLGRETALVEAQGTSVERTTTTTWDGTSFRPLTVSGPDRVTTYSYDAQGRLISTVAHSVKD